MKGFKISLKSTEICVKTKHMKDVSIFDRNCG